MISDVMPLLADRGGSMGYQPTALAAQPSVLPSGPPATTPPVPVGGPEATEPGSGMAPPTMRQPDPPPPDFSSWYSSAQPN